MAEWSYNNFYDTQEDFVLAMAEVLHEEVVDLEKAGAKFIQIDEPAVSTRPEDLPLAIRAMAVVVEGIDRHDRNSHLLRRLRGHLSQDARYSGGCYRLGDGK